MGIRAVVGLPLFLYKEIMKKVLDEKFFEHPAPEVAQKLLGKFLVRRVNNKEIVSMITEVEAYEGVNDKASHAHRGVTERNKAMFGNPGIWYVYFTYGTHWMLNIVTGHKGHPSAVLIRGVEAVSGPGRLTKFFSIDKSLNGKTASRRDGLWIEDRGIAIEKKRIIRTARIGVSYAGPYWSRRKYRFVLE